GKETFNAVGDLTLARPAEESPRPDQSPEQPQLEPAQPKPAKDVMDAREKEMRANLAAAKTDADRTVILEQLRTLFQRRLDRNVKMLSAAQVTQDDKMRQQVQARIDRYQAKLRALEAEMPSVSRPAEERVDKPAERPRRLQPDIAQEDLAKPEKKKRVRTVARSSEKGFVSTGLLTAMGGVALLVLALPALKAAGVALSAVLLAKVGLVVVGAAGGAYLLWKAVPPLADWAKRVAAGVRIRVSDDKMRQAVDAELIRPNAATQRSLAARGTESALFASISWQGRVSVDVLPGLRLTRDELMSRMKDAVTGADKSVIYSEDAALLPKKLLQPHKVVGHTHLGNTTDLPVSRLAEFLRPTVDDLLSAWKHGGAHFVVNPADTRVRVYYKVSDNGAVKIWEYTGDTPETVSVRVTETSVSAILLEDMTNPAKFVTVTDAAGVPATVPVWFFALAAGLQVRGLSDIYPDLPTEEKARRLMQIHDQIWKSMDRSRVQGPDVKPVVVNAMVAFFLTNLSKDAEALRPLLEKSAERMLDPFLNELYQEAYKGREMPPFDMDSNLSWRTAQLNARRAELADAALKVSVRELPAAANDLFGRYLAGARSAGMEPMAEPWSIEVVMESEPAAEIDNLTGNSWMDPPETAEGKRVYRIHIIPTADPVQNLARLAHEAAHAALSHTRARVEPAAHDEFTEILVNKLMERSLEGTEWEAVSVEVMRLTVDHIRRNNLTSFWRGQQLLDALTAHVERSGAYTEAQRLALLQRIFGIRDMTVDPLAFIKEMIVQLLEPVTLPDTTRINRPSAIALDEDTLFGSDSPAAILALRKMLENNPHAYLVVYPSSGAKKNAQSTLLPRVLAAMQNVSSDDISAIQGRIIAVDWFHVQDMNKAGKVSLSRLMGLLPQLIMGLEGVRVVTSNEDLYTGRELLGKLLISLAKGETLLQGLGTAISDMVAEKELLDKQA
ncbi:MAG TPA: hypothetical protein P5079_10600, partial [Elusimicrobiota bacterium]|nr:hypothetical protein [Elusimicrobiota bacterium]